MLHSYIDRDDEWFPSLHCAYILVNTPSGKYRVNGMLYVIHKMVKKYNHIPSFLFIIFIVYRNCKERRSLWRRSRSFFPTFLSDTSSLWTPCEPFPV